jgi:hypothetical protein
MGRDLMKASATPLEYRAVYARAFEEFGAGALWKKVHLAQPSPEHALVI